MKRYIISSITPNAEINTNFFNSIKNYAHRNRAEIILMPTDLSKFSQEDLDKNEYILLGDLKLNNNLIASIMPIKHSQVDPITGLERIGHNNKSYIYSSPKQRLKSIPNPSENLPRVLMTPGSVSRTVSAGTKAAIISNIDHVNGALIVEIENSSIYHYRQVQADRHGSFIDLGTQYNSDGSIKKVELEALIPGDYHCGFTDPVVKNVIINIIKKYNPKYLVLHDFFDGISINHHMDGKILTKARMGDLNDLTSELLFAANELKQLSNIARKVVVVKSNHDDFIDRWINEGKYVYDARNHIIGLELALAKANGRDPLEYGLTKYQKYDNVKFLELDESFKISKKDIEVGAHGHKGANGSRGSTSGLEKCYGNIVYGHSHTPEILRGVWVVGTSTHLKLGYNEGPSSWMQSMCLVYPNGARQLINVIKNKSVY